jgi:hypothetical protein
MHLTAARISPIVALIAGIFDDEPLDRLVAAFDNW